MLYFVIDECRFAERHYAKCHYAECRVARRFEKIALRLENIAKTLAQPKYAKISTLKLSLKVQNIYTKPLLKH